MLAQQGEGGNKLLINSPMINFTINKPLVIAIVLITVPGDVLDRSAAPAVTKGM